MRFSRHSFLRNILASKGAIGASEGVIRAVQDF